MSSKYSHPIAQLNEERQVETDNILVTVNKLIFKVHEKFINGPSD